MKRSSIKFLHRVRIHGGEFDASARAMHRDGMTSSFQAAVETVSIATIERKQMSTKTTFKRIALGTVAALGFGLLSVVPSQGMTFSDKLSLSSATASQLTGETATSTSAVATLTFLSSHVDDSISVTATLVDAPAGNTVTPSMLLTETTTAEAKSGGTVLVTTATSGVTAGTAIVVAQKQSGTDNVNATAKFKVYLNGPTKVGTYVVKLTPTMGAGGGTLGSTAQTLTITVSTNPALDTVATSATSILNKGETASATTDDVVTHSKTITTAALAAATINVGLLNAAGVATVGESFTAVITGPGTLGSIAPAVTPHATAVGRAITVKAGNLVQVFPDGSSGVATISISSAAGALLATEKVTFYGATTTLKATVVKPVIGATATPGTILVTAADASGTEVQDASINVFSSATTIASNAYTACSAYNATNGAVKAAGYLCSVTGVKAGTATITPTTLTSATDTTVGAVSGTGVSIRVGSTTPASVTVTADKSAYIPGEKATITVVLKDSTGLELADGAYTDIFAEGGIAANYTLGAGSDTTTAEAVLAFASGKQTYTVYMPVAETDVKFSWTTADVAAASGKGLATANRDVDGEFTVSVKSSSGAAATDAANEATDAANAATDAANAAAEAADAATAAAQDAADAVAALSTEVATLIAALKKQITSLTNLVIKIQKKVKA